MAQGSSQDYGLQIVEVGQRRLKFGLNKLETRKAKGPLRILLQQFSDVLVLVLLGAAAIAFFLGDPEDTIAIFAIVVLNAILGFYQEFRAEKAMDALKALAAPMAKVRRSGQVLLVPAGELVPGDIVLLEAGYIVPADLRIIRSFELAIDESALTGESMPVTKASTSIELHNVPVAEQKNMAFKGTITTAGRAEGVVVCTGMATELGRIATLLKDEVELSTPLQRRMARFAKGLSAIVIALCFVIFLVGWLKGEEPVLMFMTSLSLAVAAIPEALPAVITVSLALGARKMSRQKALVRKLSAVEALGSVTYICTDKTGTLTKNLMEAKAFVNCNGRQSSLPGTWDSEDPVDWMVRVDRNSLFKCRGRAPDKSTARRRFHAFNVTQRS